MLIRFFRNNYFIQFIGLLFLGVVLWINVFISPPPIVENSFTSPLYNLLTSIIHNHLILILIAFLFLITEAIYLNYLLVKHEILQRNTFIAAAVYLVLMSHSLQLQHLYPALISHFFILTAIDALLQIDLKGDYLRLSYKTGLYIGIATLFYLPSASLLILIWITLLIYHIPNWRPWVIPILGLLSPYLFLFTFYFWMDNAYEFLIHYQDYFSQIKMMVSSNDGYEQIIMTILAFFISISFFRVLGQLSNKKIAIRKKILIILYFFFIGFIILFLNNDLIIHASTIYIPITIFISIYFTDLRRIFWTDLFFTLTVLFIIFTHFQY